MRLWSSSNNSNHLLVRLVIMVSAAGEKRTGNMN